jgi:prophage regulatory protein
MPKRILRLPEVQATTGKSRSTIYLRISEKLFPSPVRLGPRMVGWPEDEIAAMNAARIRGASDDEIRALVTKLEDSRKDAA